MKVFIEFHMVKNTVLLYWIQILFKLRWYIVFIIHILNENSLDIIIYLENNKCPIRGISL